MIERALITSEDGRHLNLARALPDAAASRRAGASPAAPAAGEAPRILTVAEMQEAERQNLKRALAASGGRLSGDGGAAQLLGMHPNTLASRLKALGIKRRTAG